jgi:hypothetical protein
MVERRRHLWENRQLVFLEDSQRGDGPLVELPQPGLDLDFMLRPDMTYEEVRQIVCAVVHAGQGGG